MEAQISQFPAQWQRAMDRATRDGLHAVRINPRTYAVRSTSKATCDQHLVTLDSTGRIISCDNCPGWAGRSHPCKHAGAVARRLVREGHTVSTPVVIETDAIERRQVGRSQLFREAVR